MKLLFSSVFEQDFAELVTYFAREASVDVATRFEESAYQVIELLQQHPEQGRLRKELRPEGIRSFRLHDFNRYLLFYQVKGNELVLLRLRYGGMNLPALFMSFD
jgi:plasmid stabilization system protein ParE